MARFTARPVAILFALCLVVGLGVIGWRAIGRRDNARAAARTEARAAGASLELQLSQAANAAEVLGALAKSGKSGLADFQKVAKELLAAHPGLTSLDLEPGGVVSEIVPQAGYQQTVGLNLLKDLGQRVNEAIARRVLTVTGPVALYHGESGIVARVPVFQRTLDGRESFWGFVAVSMQFQEALARAQVDKLPRQGYAFAFFAPASAGQKSTVIASHGSSSFKDAVQQPVRVQNLVLCLALQPQGGWINSTKVALEILAVLLISALVALLANQMQSRRAVEARLTEVTQRLTNEAGRSRAIEDGLKLKERVSATQAELKQTQLALEQAESKVAQIQGLLDASTREKDEAAQLNQAERIQAQAALAKAHETMAQLQVRLDAASEAENKAAAAAEAARHQNQTATAELQALLEAAKRLARDSSKASAATLAQLEQSSGESKAHRLALEQSEARVAELSELLGKAREELSDRQDASAISANAPLLELVPTAASPIAEATPEPSNHDGGLSLADPIAMVAAPAVVEAPLESAPSAEPLVTRPLAGKAPKRKKARRDDQMDLFKSGDAIVQATEPSAAPVVDLAVESLAPREGIANTEEDTKHHLKALEQFAQAHASASEKIRDGLVQGDLPAAMRLLQALELAANEIDATEVHRAATALASACRESTDSGEIEALWVVLDKALRELVVDPKPVSPAKDDRPAPARRLPAAPPVDLPQLRKALHQFVPLLTDKDPGAKDCLKDNRSTFRSLFTPEGYVEFEQLVKNSDIAAALEQLKKAARKHGITI